MVEQRASIHDISCFVTAAWIILFIQHTKRLGVDMITLVGNIIFVRTKIECEKGG